MRACSLQHVDKKKVETIDFEKFLIVATLTLGQHIQDDDWLPENRSQSNGHLGILRGLRKNVSPLLAHFDLIAHVGNYRTVIPKLNATGYIEDFPHIPVDAQHSGKDKLMYASIPEDILHNVFKHFIPMRIRLDIFLMTISRKLDSRKLDNSLRRSLDNSFSMQWYTISA